MCQNFRNNYVKCINSQGQRIDVDLSLLLATLIRKPDSGKSPMIFSGTDNISE